MIWFVIKLPRVAQSYSPPHWRGWDHRWRGSWTLWPPSPPAGRWETGRVWWGHSPSSTRPSAPSGAAATPRLAWRPAGSSAGWSCPRPASNVSQLSVLQCERLQATYVSVEYEHHTRGVHLAGGSQTKLLIFAVRMSKHEVSCNYTLQTAHSRLSLPFSSTFADGYRSVPSVFCSSEVVLTKLPSPTSEPENQPHSSFSKSHSVNAFVSDIFRRSRMRVLISLFIVPVWHDTPVWRSSEGSLLTARCDLHEEYSPRHKHNSPVCGFY